MIHARVEVVRSSKNAVEGRGGKHMAEYFEIDGHWLDDKDDEFEGYIVKSTDDYTKEEDDSIFYYGLSEDDIKHAIETGEPVNNEFIITSYRRAI